MTAANARYWPGVVALHHSYLASCAGDFDFLALLNGDASLADQAEARGIPYMLNPTLPTRSFPVTDRRPPETAEVHFYRLLAPSLAGEADRVVYIDADAVILQNLAPLATAQFAQPVAAMRSNSPLVNEISGVDVPGGYGFISSFLIFNIEQWARQGITAKCVDMMERPPVRFHTGDQAVLNWALIDNWHELPQDAQAHAGHLTFTTTPRHRVFVLHFLGTNPWEDIPAQLQPYPEHKMAARKVWRDYYEASGPPC